MPLAADRLNGLLLAHRDASLPAAYLSGCISSCPARLPADEPQPSVELGADAVVFAAQANLGHVAHAYLRAIRVDLEQDSVELLGALQAGLADDGGIQLLALYGRQAAELARRYLDVLRGDGVFHIHRRQLEIVQLGRIEPDAHGVLGAEHLEVLQPGEGVFL